MSAQYRVRFVVDPDASFEECNGEVRPLTAEEYAENEYMREGKPIPYSEYLQYYGNPDRHVYLMSEVQKKCRCCGRWEHVASTGSIDYMDDDKELRLIGVWMTPEELEAQTWAEHLRMTGLEDLEEAGYRIPATVRCAKRGCKHWHIANSPFCAKHQEVLRVDPDRTPAHV